MLQVACCQVDTVWQDKAASHARVTDLLEQAPLEKGALVVLPEYFATSFSLDVPKIAEGAQRESETFLAQTARRLGVYLAGGVVNTCGGDSPKGRNELVVFDLAGELVTRYCKLHPFSFGGEPEHYESGNCIATFTWQTMTAAPFICYDLRFPEVFRHAARRGVELFVVIANWPMARREHWMALARARAIENQAYVVAVNRCGADPNYTYGGDSRIINPRGEVQADAGNRECVITAQVDPESLGEYRKQFPALDDIRSEFLPE